MEAEAKFPLVVAVITGAIVGAAIVQGLNARAKSPVYFVTEIDVKDVDRYVNEFVPLAQASVTNHGGKLLAAGPNLTLLDGPPPKRVAINLWDSMESLQERRNSADYRKARETGEKYATFHSFTLEGVSK